MSELAGIGIVQGGAAGLLALVVVLILTGRLVPRSTLDDVRQERDMWRDTAQVYAEGLHTAQDQAGELLEISRTAVPLLRALPHPPAEEVNRRAAVDQGMGAQT